MLGPSSTRHKGQKAINSARFFKKIVHPTDENEKNGVNYLEKITMKKGNPLCQLKKNSQSRNKRKASANNLTSMSSKILKTQGPAPLSTKNSDHHGRSFKNLKLTSSTEFPKILIKSISQTTMNKKSQEKTMKLMQKIGPGCGIGLGDKKIKKRSSCVTNNGGQQLKINQFRLGKKLGNGRFGSVYLAEEKQTKLLVAIKVLNKTKIKQAEMEDQILMEIKLQMYMNHPNVLKLFGYFHDSKNIYLILQYCSQCLFKDFRHKGKLSEEETAYYGKQAISALKYMHNEYIMHRDIKPQNILIEHGVLKLSDFGWSIYSPMYKRQTFCGTVDYVPPEIVEGASYDQRVDIWALGVLLYQLASGKAPFETRDEKITYQKILKSECKYPSHFSSSLISLLKKILDKNPKNRPDLEQIQRGNWFEEYKTTGRYISKPIWTAWNSLS